MKLNINNEQQLFTVLAVIIGVIFVVLVFGLVHLNYKLSVNKQILMSIHTTIADKKKPLVSKKFGTCPVCGESVYLDKYNDKCTHCGQQLTWIDDND
jgi:ribosomal protein S27AE